MFRSTLLALLAALALAGCGNTANDNSAAPSQKPAAETRPGSAVVYQRIEALTNCSALQRQFDIADRNHEIQKDRGNLSLMEASTSYMEASNARMEELGCFG